LSLDELKTKYRRREIVATLQCGGNRRGEMTALEATAGTPWEIGAISNARWEGVLLSDVLRSCGLHNSFVRLKESTYDDGDCDQQDYDQAGIGHCHFTGQDDMSASIPTLKALKRDGDVLLAYSMNGDDIPPEHGYPLRVIVPGHVGVRSVKHLKQIRLSPIEVDGPWQRGMAYKGFGPSRKNTNGLDVSKLVSLQEQPVQSAVTVPAQNTKVQAEDIITIKGYAYSGGGKGSCTNSLYYICFRNRSS
jgi:sulfite oxidase